jgi:uncharacterized protein involved in exopolysaccharide biosynthesis
MNNNQAQLTLSQLISAILRHKVKSLMVFLLVMILAIALFVVWPREYASEGRIYVQRGGNTSGISPIASNSGVTVQDSHESEIRSVVEIARSRAIAEAVVDEVGVEEILKSPFDKLLPKLSLPSFLKNRNKTKTVEGLTPEEYQRLKRREVAIEEVTNDLVVYAEKQTSVISMVAQASSPQLAQRLVQTMFDETQKIYNNSHTAKGSTVFFEKQVQMAEDRYQDALKKQQKFRDTNGFLSIKEARGTLEKIVSELQQNIINAEVELEASTMRVEQLRASLGATLKQIPIATRGFERKSSEDAQSELFRAQDELARLTAKYSPNHPLVTQSAQRVEKMRNRAKTLQNERVQSQMKSNPVHESLDIELASAMADQASAKARLIALREKHATENKRKNQLNAQMVEAMRIEDRIEKAHLAWDLFKDKGIEAMAKKELDNSKLSSIVVVQRPSLVVKHVSPKASMFLPLGALVGILAGLGVALFFERNHLSGALNEGEVEQILEMPVLVTLPRVYSSRNMVN